MVLKHYRFDENKICILRMCTTYLLQDRKQNLYFPCQYNVTDSQDNFVTCWSYSLEAEAEVNSLE